MRYEKINPIPQFNFQINRVLTYGETACDTSGVKAALAAVRTLDEWNHAWTKLAEKAENEGRCLHAAYAYRMVEFFLKTSDPRKEAAYNKCIKNFYLGFKAELHLNYCRSLIPFEKGCLSCIHLPASRPKGIVLVCGGYDSFIEEFVLQVQPFTAQNYDVFLFDGPGQGSCLRDGVYFCHDFEKAACAVLDYFHINRCAMVGISWGGYFALRCAAFEKRITAAAAYDVLDNGFEVMTHIFPVPLCRTIRLAYRLRQGQFLNFLTQRLQKRSILADWALSQGMAITDTHTAYAFYQKLSRHTLAGITGQITQDILLLAGEKDHYIPLKQFFRLKKSLPNAKSLTCRLFTQAEGGEQHCQVGCHKLAVDTILDWLNNVL